MAQVKGNGNALRMGCLVVYVTLWHLNMFASVCAKVQIWGGNQFRNVKVQCMMMTMVQEPKTTVAGTHSWV